MQDRYPSFVEQADALGFHATAAQFAVLIRVITRGFSNHFCGTFGTPPG